MCSCLCIADPKYADQLGILVLFFSPTPRVTWTRLDKVIAEGDRYSGLNQQELVISSVSYEDEGRYSCTATNSASQSAVTQEFTVVVECKLHGGRQHFAELQ